MENHSTVVLPTEPKEKAYTGKLKITHTSGVKDTIWSHEDILGSLIWGWTIDDNQELEFARLLAMCSPSDQKMIGNNLRQKSV